MGDQKPPVAIFSGLCRRDAGGWEERFPPSSQEPRAWGPEKGWRKFRGNLWLKGSEVLLFAAEMGRCGIVMGTGCSYGVIAAGPVYFTPQLTTHLRWLGHSPRNAPPRKKMPRIVGYTEGFLFVRINYILTCRGRKASRSISETSRQVLSMQLMFNNSRSHS